jgi:hypothetical protein
LEKLPEEPPVEVRQRSGWGRTIAWLAVGSAAAVLAGIAVFPTIQSSLYTARLPQASNQQRQLDAISTNFKALPAQTASTSASPAPANEPLMTLGSGTEHVFRNPTDYAETTTSPVQDEALITGPIAASTGAAISGGMGSAGQPGDQGLIPIGRAFKNPSSNYGGVPADPKAAGIQYFHEGQGQGQGGGQLAGGVGGYAIGGGGYGGPGGAPGRDKTTELSSVLPGSDPYAASGYGGGRRAIRPEGEARLEELEKVRELRTQLDEGWDSANREQYDQIVENSFLVPTDHPLSTFSIDVDTASYSNVRRFLMGGRLPPPAAVRIEELVNYFGYSYPQPKGPEPFSVNMETAECPW